MTGYYKRLIGFPNTHKLVRLTQLDAGSAVLPLAHNEAYSRSGGNAIEVTAAGAFPLDGALSASEAGAPDYFIIVSFDGT